MSDSFMPTSAEYIRILPEIILTLAGVLIMFLEAILKGPQKGVFAPAAILGLAGALVGALVANGDPGPAFHNMMMVDGFATFFRVLVIARRHPGRVRFVRISATASTPEPANIYALMLFSIVGQCHDGVGQRADHDLHRPGDLLHRLLHSGRLPARRHAQQRSALKYFLLGSFATAFLLYGIAWIYGITGIDQSGRDPRAC